MSTTTEKKSFTELINTDGLVLVDFSAEWCGPCKMLKPILDEVKSQVGDKARIIKIDVDRNQSLATQYQITGVPTLILFKKGQPVWRRSGVMPTSQLVAVLKGNM